MMLNFLRKRSTGIVIILIFLLMLLFIFSYIPPNLLLTKTITAGGDTAAHYYPAWYMKDYLMSHFKIVGWAPGWYCGFPMFQFYFPLTFIIMALLSYVISLQVAFKLVTFLAIISIPCAAYFMFRRLNFSKPVSAVALAFMLPFLFHEANSMWGGNIPSTFAGEFSYALAIALSMVYLGLMYEGIGSKKHLLKNSILLAIIGLMHIYTLIWVVTTSFFLLLSPDFKKRLVYWFKVNALGFLLLAFWIIPLIYNLEFTSAYAVKWGIENWQEVFPKIFWPFYAFTAIGLVAGIMKRDMRIFYLLFSIMISTMFYFLAVKIGVVDIRFIPFIQVLLLLVAAYAFTLIHKTKLRGISIVPLILLLITILWVQSNVTFIPEWAQWNYKGFEQKNLWPQFSAVNDFLKGNENDARVVYEHSMDHNAAGTTRAFELLPFLSGRSTLEGLYMQSTPTSPFVFYTQSEISQQASCPFPNRQCTHFNLTAGTNHLKLFNVKHFVAISKKVKAALRNNSEYKLVLEKQPYEVYDLKSQKNEYVVVPEFKPVFFPRKNWQNRSYELFMSHTEVPVVFDDSVKEEPMIVAEKISKECNVTSQLKQEEILFKTDCVGMPHLVKVSYFPRWKSENGEKIYLVSPSFMLIYPEKENMRLYFGRTWVENGALVLSLIGWMIVLAYLLINRHKIRKIF